MPTTKINGVNLYWELNGQQGAPMVLIHGSWVDHHDWDGVVGELSQNFRVLTYDRRGHSQSDRLEEQGNTEQDVSDLVALIENLDLSPAHISGNSFGASIVLKTAAKRPDLFQTLSVHEPPLFGLLRENPEAQQMLQIVKSRIAAVANLIAKRKNEEAAREFAETVALGPGAWQQLAVAVQQMFIYNAPTFYDETQDPASLNFETEKLSRFNKPTLLTHGSESPPFFLMVMEELSRAIPGAIRMVFEGAGHVPHVSHPAQFIKVLREFCQERN